MNKRRFLSLLLCLCMAVSLFTGFAATASADNGDIITHTVVSGQNLYYICKGYGLDYYQCKNAIMILNNFTTETQLNVISVGQQIKLPRTNAIAATIKSTSTVTTTTTTTTTVGGTTTTTTSSSTVSGGAALGLMSGDTIAYYLIPYTMKSGDTIGNVCNAIGSSYSAYSKLIKDVNGIKNLNLVWAGKLVYFPTNVAPSTGSYYVVVAHTVRSGETMTAICRDYGTSFLNNYTMIEGLNDNKNLNHIVPGEKVYVPALSSIVYAGSGTGTGTGAGTGTGTGTGAGEATAANGYNITFVSQTGGKPYAMNANGSAISKAPAGTVVTIDPNANFGYAQESITGVYSYGSDAAALSIFDNTFTMPNDDVIITVKYAAGKIISKAAAEGGEVETLVDGVDVGSAIFGKKVTVIPQPDNGYATETVTYSYKDGSTTVSKDIEAKDGVYSFTMPDAAVSVSVSFKKAATWKINTDEFMSNGAVVYQIDGGNVSRASEGQYIYVKPIPEEGYIVRNISVEDSAGGIVDVEMDSTGTAGFFSMPAKSVKVSVIFGTNTLYSINTAYTKDGVASKANTVGSVSYLVEGKAATQAREGDKVTIIASPKAGYTQDLNDTVVRFTNNNSIVSSLIAAKNTFIMPGTAVTVTVDFAPGAHSITKAKTSNGSFSFAVNEIAAVNAQKGEVVEIIPAPNPNYEIDEKTLLVNYTEKDPGTGKMKAVKLELGSGITALTSGDKTRYFFTMPNENVTVTCGFKLGKTHAIKVDCDKNLVAVKCLVDGVAVDNMVAGHKVIIDMFAKPGVEITKVEAGGKEIKAEYGEYSFTMPNKDITVKITTKLTDYGSLQEI